jgi:hypothetical protein
MKVPIVPVGFVGVLLLTGGFGLMQAEEESM